MIEIKRDGDWNITNFKEIQEELSKIGKKLLEKWEYYIDKYNNACCRALIKKFRSLEKAIEEAFNGNVYSKCIETREIIIDGVNVNFFISASNFRGIHIHVYVPSGDDIIYLQFVNNQYNNRGLPRIVLTEGLYVLPIIIESHACKRFLEYNSLRSNWKFDMMEDLGIMYQLPCMINNIEDDFVYPTNSDIINLETSMKDLAMDSDKDFQEALRRVMKSCLYGTIHTRNGFIMIPPKEGKLFVVKTFIEGRKLKERQKEIIYLQRRLIKAEMLEVSPLIVSYNTHKKEGII